MRGTRLLRALATGAFVAAVTSCSFLGGIFGGYEARVGASFVEGETTGPSASVAGGRLASVTQQTASIEGMYFGELEIVAYQYAPGFEDATGFGFTNDDPVTDWAYYTVLQSGHPAARDILLQSGELVDIAAFNDGYDVGLDPTFAEVYDRFSIDFLEVNVYRSGILIDGSYFGMNAELNGLATHPLHRYPPLDTIPDFYRDTNVDGFESNNQTFSILFARSDWYPTPVLVQTEESSVDPDAFVVSWSSRTMTDDEIRKIESLVTNGTQRRFYGNMIIIPYDGPTEVAVTDGGPGMANPVAYIRFDYDTLLDDATWADFEADGVIDSDIVYRMVDDVPFGLTVEFVDEPVAE